MLLPDPPGLGRHFPHICRPPPKRSSSAHTSSHLNGTSECYFGSLKRMPNDVYGLAIHEEPILLCTLPRRTSACGSLDTLRVFGVNVSSILPGLGMAGGAISSRATLTRGRAKSLEGLAWLISTPYQMRPGSKDATYSEGLLKSIYKLAIPQRRKFYD